MASKKRSTKWKPTAWERTYRGDPIWIEEMFSHDPKWSWTVIDGREGRARTRVAAMRAAERAVDASLNESVAEDK